MIMRMIIHRRLKQKSIVAFLLILIIVLIGFLITTYNGFVVSSQLDTKPLDDEYISEWSSADSRLIRHIREHYLITPSSRDIPYKLESKEKKDYSQKGLMTNVKQLFSINGGFFIECGAMDGETWSNTLALEKFNGWTGLLIEPDRDNFAKLKAKNRKAWLINGCLDGGVRAKKMILHGAGLYGALQEHTNIFRKFVLQFMHRVEAQHIWCFPLESLLLAVNQTKVDFFSLDVEGAEPNILEQTNWSKLDINVFLIEFTVFQGLVFDMDSSKKKKDKIRSLISTYLPKHKEFGVFFHDIVFYKNSSS